MEKNQSRLWNPIFILTLLFIASGCGSGQAPVSSSLNPTLGPPIPLTDIQKQTLQNFTTLVTEVYPGYAPTRNRKALINYIQSPDFLRHKETAVAYYDGYHGMTIEDAQFVLENRDPVNIGMSTPYNGQAWQNLLNTLHQQGFIRSAITVQQTPLRNSAYSRSFPLVSNSTRLFSERPYTVSVYSETFLWPHWDGSETDKQEVAILSVPAPALDTPEQPHYNYYIQHGVFNQVAYRVEMMHLARTIVKATIDHQNTAFQNQGINRLVLSLYGQASFLSAVAPNDRLVANQIMMQTLIAEIQAARSAGVLRPNLPIVMSLLQRDPLVQFTFQAAQIGTIVGSILTNAQNRDMFVNAWDPHSLPGNGNDFDNSLDGWYGRATAFILAQIPHFNELLTLIKYVRVLRETFSSPFLP